MNVAALYDVRGNLPALDAVLADPVFAAAEAVVVGGDVAARPMPAEVPDALVALERPLRWVRGNADRAVLDHLARGDLDPGAHDDPAGRTDAARAWGPASHGPSAQAAWVRRTAAVAASAGKNDSIASSSTVMSTAVPNVVTVLKKRHWTSPTSSASGTTTSLDAITSTSPSRVRDAG